MRKNVELRKRSRVEYRIISIKMMIYSSVRNERAEWSGAECEEDQEQNLEKHHKKADG